MKMQVMTHTHTHTDTHTHTHTHTNTHTHTHTHTLPLSLFTPLTLTSSYQGTNSSQLWDSAFAAQAFLEVRTKQGCVVTLHDQRGRGHLQGCVLCVLTPPKAGAYIDRRFSGCTCMKVVHWFFQLCVCADASVLVHVCGCCIVCMWCAVIHSQCIRLLCT